MKLLVFALLILVFSGKIQAQPEQEKVLTQLEERYQDCLDNGTNMLSCAAKYYSQMDSMLNVVYKQSMNTLNPSQKTSLKADQEKWLLSRDKQFKKADLQSKKTNTIDAQMIALDKKAGIVNERIRFLLKKYKRG